MPFSPWSNTASAIAQVAGGAALAIPSGASVGPPGTPVGSSFGQAADLYDTVGVNIHSFREDWPEYLNPTAFLNNLYELGVRHVRDGVVASFYSSKGFKARPIPLAIHNRNLGLTKTSVVGNQPIFLTTITGTPPGTFGQYSDDGATKAPFFSLTNSVAADFYNAFDGNYPHFNGDASPAATRPEVGYQIPDGVTSDPNAAISLPVWAWSDSEFKWGVVGAISGPNEPGSGQDKIRSFEQNLYNGLKQASRASIPAFGGHRVVTENGIQPAGQGRVSQVPKIGTSVVNNGYADSVVGGELSSMNDLGDMHPYHVGIEPSHEEITSKTTFTIHNYDGRYGGGRIPLIISEMGEVSRGMDSAIAAMNGNAHAGYWPAPDDVISEHLVRRILLYWARGIRRYFWYTLYDHNAANLAESAFGLILSSHIKKPQYYAMKNLLAVIGFQEAPAGSRAALPYSATGFTPGAPNNHVAMFATTQLAAGGIYDTSAHRLDHLQIQQTPTQWTNFLMPQAMIWDREPGNWSTTTPGTGSPVAFGNVAAGRKSRTSQDVILTLPGNVTSVSWAQPAAGGPSGSPGAGGVINASNEALGRTFAPLTISPSGSNKQVTVPISNYTKAIRITTA